MNTELASVLKHELTHSFLNSLAGGRCPTWLNEGMAQMMESRTSGTLAEPLAEMHRHLSNPRGQERRSPSTHEGERSREQVRIRPK